jgi:DNA helicase-2/ATP-dependent DNA helicase PcrA
MHYGNAVHTVLKDYFESVRAGRPKPEDDVAQCLIECLGAMHFDDPYQRELYEREGGQQLREFVRRCCGQPPPDVIGTERTFEVTIAGVRVRGRVDRLDRIEGSRVAVVDYKTGTPKMEKDARDSLQLSIYAIAAREQWEFEPERLVFYNLRDNTEVVATRNEQDLAKAGERVKEVAARIGEGHFEARPGFHCRRCRYWSICPATEERLYNIPAAQAVKVN